MTQAVTDTSNNSIYTMLQQADSTNSTSTNNGFASAIEESSDKIAQTIGDFKNAKTFYADTRANFKSILKQEIKQSNDESSLNLTLADDIKNFIAQLQETQENKTDTAAETTEILADIQNIAGILTEELPKPTITEKNVDTELTEENTILENTEIQNTDNLQNDTEIISSITNKPADTSKAITNDKNSAQEPTVDEPEISDEILRELNVESVDAETTGDAQQEFDMQQQTPEEHAIKAMIGDSDTTFDNKITESQKTVNTENITSKSNQTDKVIEQISKQLNGINSNSKVNIVLNPESLGKISIQVAKSAEGMSAQLTVSTNETKEILLKNLDGLKETLLSHGINSDNVSIKMNETQKSEYKQDWTEQENSGNKNKEQHHQQKQEKEKGIFEKMMAFINTDEMESI